MKKCCIYLLLSLLLFVACKNKGKAPVAQEEPAKEQRKGPFAQIEFPEGTDYYVSYSERVVQEHGYPVYNPGTVPLVIDSVITICGCTDAVAPKKPILQGQTDTIHVSYDGNGFVNGYFVKNIKIFSNADTIVNLTFRGYYSKGE